MTYPKVYLAMDNCVFYKRWTDPDEWAGKMAGIGIRYIEASADTELDPLYMGTGYLEDWIRKVQLAEERYGVKVCNLYSGHGTYTTLGLTHPDERVREHLTNNWFFPMAETAGKLGCGMGFFAHAFKHQVLQSYDTYMRYVDILEEHLSRINRHAASCGCGNLGIEQMYTPHQYPWRIQDAKRLMERVSKRSGRNFYFTEDVGHHHSRFNKPQKNRLQNGTAGLWLGTDSAYGLAETAGIDAWDAIALEIEKNPHLFSSSEDADCYAWLEQLGRYSPIVHLQQTAGDQSVHLPFTQQENKRGKITGSRVLQALKESFERPAEEGLPAPVSDIYLTLELFSGTTSLMRDVLADCRESVLYWRQFIPEDGLTLDALATRMAGLQ